MRAGPAGLIRLAAGPWLAWPSLDLLPGMPLRFLPLAPAARPCAELAGIRAARYKAGVRARVPDLIQS